LQTLQALPRALCQLKMQMPESTKKLYLKYDTKRCENTRCFVIVPHSHEAYNFTDFHTKYIWLNRPDLIRRSSFGGSHDREDLPLPKRVPKVTMLSKLPTRRLQPRSTLFLPAIPAHATGFSDRCQHPIPSIRSNSRPTISSTNGRPQTKSSSVMWNLGLKRKIYPSDNTHLSPCVRHGDRLWREKLPR